MNQKAKNISESDLNESVDRFENTWKNSGAADIAEFLPPIDDPNHASILCELIRVDLELRWKNGEQPIVEDYVGRFANANLNSHDTEQLGFEEYRLRFQAGQEVSPEMYSQRLGIDTSNWPRWSHENSRPESVNGRPASSKRQTQPVVFPEIGARFHGFDIVGQLGQGAFGRVYLARQEDLANRFVALKVTEESDTEPQSLARLQHTNIIPIYSLKKEANLQSICMPFLGVATMQDLFLQSTQEDSLFRSGKELISTVAGKRTDTIVATVSPNSTPELKDIINRGNIHGESMPAIAGLNYQQTALWMVSRVADGLAYAHSRGIVHGDLKPANILISDDGEPLLLDFHLSRSGASSTSETLVGGTLPYMSTHHLRSLQSFPRAKDVNASCDIFSLGVVLYESLTGVLPYENHGVDEVAFERMIQDRKKLPIPIQKHCPHLSPDIESIVEHCLSPRRENCYQSARELQFDIERHLSNLPLKHAPNRSLVERSRKWVKRHPKLSSATSIAIISLVAIGIVSVLVAGRLTRAANIERENDSVEFVRSATVASLPVVMRRDQNTDLSDSIGRLVELVENRTGPTAEHYEATLARLRHEQRERETLEFSSINYWVAYRLFNAAEATTSQHERDRDLNLAVDKLDFVIAITKEKTPSSILELKASILERQGHSERAEELRSSIAPSQHVATIPERLMEAAELRRNNRDQEAIEQLRVLTGEKPDIPQAWLMMGRAYTNLKQYDKAEVCYSMCIQLDPGAPWAFLNRGVDALAQRNYELAKLDFDKAIERAGNDAASFLNRALALKGMREPELALADLTKAIELGTSETRAYFVRSQIFNQLDRKPEAQQDFEKFLELKPNDELSWLSRGMAHIKINQPEQALVDFREALKANQKSTTAYQNIATVEAEFLDRTSSAVEALTRIIELEPGNLVAIVTRGVLNARMGNRELAHADAQSVLKKSSSADILYRASGIFALTSNTQQQDAKIAIDLLTKASFKDPRLVLKSISNDPDLAPVRPSEEYKELVKLLQSLATGNPK